jgi:tryptophan 2,3-dioxygenase
MELKPEIIERIELLDKKYQAMGQNLTSYLDGLLYADYLTYWDYIHLDTLLTLQTPKTNIPDENIFIMYHQITELYFKLCLHEYNQLAEKENMDAAFFVERVKRINRYFEALITSFDVMVDGMDPKQFLKFRMSLLPASGFQSGQYRKIEICSTTFKNLVAKDIRPTFSDDISDEQIEKMYQHIYWREGATELASGKKTLTLVQFEEKYSEQFIQLAKKFKHKMLIQTSIGLYHIINLQCAIYRPILKTLLPLAEPIGKNIYLHVFKNVSFFLSCGMKTRPMNGVKVGLKVLYLGSLNSTLTNLF